MKIDLTEFSSDDLGMLILALEKLPTAEMGMDTLIDLAHGMLGKPSEDAPAEIHEKYELQQRKREEEKRQKEKKREILKRQTEVLRARLILMKNEHDREHYDQLTRTTGSEE